jgi:hypothetical protein
MISIGTLLCLTGGVSFIVGTTAVAHASGCSFTLASSSQSQAVAVVSNGYGYQTEYVGTITVSKYTDGCGNEYGTLNAQVPFYVTGGQLNIENTSDQVNVNPGQTFVQTPATAGNNQVCGGVTLGYYAGGTNIGGGGGCTPN